MKRQTRNALLGATLATTLATNVATAQSIDYVTVQTGVTTEQAVNNRFFLGASYGSLVLEGLYSIDNADPKNSFGEYNFTVDIDKKVKPLVSVKSDGTSIDGVLVGVQIPTEHCTINTGLTQNAVEASVLCAKNYGDWKLQGLYVGQAHKEDGFSNYLETEVQYKINDDFSAYARAEDLIDHSDLRGVAGVAYTW